MTDRAEFLIDALSLAPHPEGGHFREVFRSDESVTTHDGRGDRSALTAIYFLLRAGESSAWHRVLSDEVWVHLEGAPIALRDAAEPADSWASVVRLGPVDPPSARLPIHVIRAGRWQAATPETDDRTGYSLVCCCVGPGFDFADFTLVSV